MFVFNVVSFHEEEETMKMKRVIIYVFNLNKTDYIFSVVHDCCENVPSSS